MTTGVAEDIGGSRAVFVEECTCPPGYTGLSCQVSHIYFGGVIDL